MNFLILNVGSSSIKYSIYKKKEKILGDYFQNILTKKSREKCINKIIKKIDKEKIIIEAIGHRIVHGKNLTESCILTKNKIKIIEDCCELAPLHNIPELEVIRICEKMFKVKQIGVFDTSFYTNMPDVAKYYAIPKKYFKDIKRYGFHGTSHRFVSRKLKGKVITCHLGNGCSITAIKDGKAIDTTMGFTPLEGLIMGTRCGDIDVAVVEYLAKKYKMDISEILNMFNKESGLLGISGISNDMRDIYKSNSKNAKLAKEMFVYKAIKKIGALIAILKGLDTLVFTAGMGENEHYIRKDICENFGFLGLNLDKSKNKKNSTIISSDESKIKVMVIPTNEELMIVEDVMRLI